MLQRFLITLLFLLASATLQADQEFVEHQLSFEHRTNQYVSVRLSFEVQQETVDLAMPNWTPGSYLIRDYAAQVEDLRVQGRSGKALTVDKVEKHRWRIETAGEDWINVQYRIWAGELAVNASWVESDFALLNGAGIFLYNESTRQLAQHLQLVLPETWRNSHVALPISGPEGIFLAENFDELVDSPILLGNTATYPSRLTAMPMH